MCRWIVVVIQQLTFVSPTYVPERLPLPVTKPTQVLFGMWVIPGIAMVKVLVGYDRPAWMEMRTAPFKQSHFTCGQCDHGKLW